MNWKFHRKQPRIVSPSDIEPATSELAVVAIPPQKSRRGLLRMLKTVGVAIAAVTGASALTQRNTQTAYADAYGNFSSTTNTPAVTAKSTISDGVYSLSSSNNAVHGASNSGNGVAGYSESSYGIYGYSDTNNGIYGTSNKVDGNGVYGTSTNLGGNGVCGYSPNGGYGVYGNSPNNSGVYGNSTNGFGVSGNSPNSSGVYGNSTVSNGVEGNSANGYGVYGTSGSNVGVYGYSANYIGIEGGSTNSIGMYGYSSSDIGVYGYSTDSIGVYAISNSSYGLFSYSSGTTQPSLYAAGGSVAGLFGGDVQVNGNLSKAGGSFLIDHPLDPANKKLYHSFVESPDMKNIYDGVTVLDHSGQAVIALPDWFEALNTDFRYQLTAIGASAPNLHISHKIQNNQFTIAGGQEGLEVSWLVTGIRQDAWAQQHRIPVEEAKSAAERGLYYHPEVHGQPTGKSILQQPTIQQPPKQPTHSKA